MRRAAPTAEPAVHRGRRRAASSIGLLLHLATAVLYAGTGLVAPEAAVLPLAAVWVAVLVVALRWRRRHPKRVLAAPAVSVAVWAAVVTAGDAVFGWTA